MVHCVANIAVPRYSSLIHFGTRGKSKTDQTTKHVVGQCCGWPIQVLASVMSPENARSAEAFEAFFFLVKMRPVQGFTSSEADEYQGMTVS